MLLLSFDRAERHVIIWDENEIGSKCILGVWQASRDDKLAMLRAYKVAIDTCGTPVATYHQGDIVRSDDAFNALWSMIEDEVDHDWDAYVAAYVPTWQIHGSAV